MLNTLVPLVNKAMFFHSLYLMQLTFIVAFDYLSYWFKYIQL
jgi:hypothetical protein